jgi:hypothetical protein
VKQGCGRLEIRCLAKSMEFSVLRQEGQTIGDDHARPEVVEQVFGGERADGAVALQKLVG